MKKFKIVIVIVVVFIFCGANSYAGNEYSENKDSDWASREDYLISKLKSSFSKQQNYKLVKSGNETKPNREITILLKEAVQNYDSYSEDSQQYLSKFLMRPDSAANNWPWDGGLDFYLPGTIETFEPDVGTYPAIGGKFKFWYVTNTETDGGGITHTTSFAYIQSMAAAFESVYSTTITTMGYPIPLDDSGVSPNGDDSKMDIYVMNCGFYDVYGYTVPEQVSGGYSSFMVIDNDYTDFVLPNNETPEEAMQVTAAHEFHHAVQFGININASTWIMEATSTWMEDQVFDDVDDNLQYLNSSEGFFLNPHQPIDSEFQWYNNWILLEYMVTEWSQDSVKSIWVDYLSSSDNGTSAVVNVISDEGSTLQDTYKDFARVNYIQEGFYSDYQAYNSVHITNAQSGIGYNLDYSSDLSDIFVSESISINHLATKYFKLTPGSSIDSGDDDKLTIYIYGMAGRQIDVVPIVTNADTSITEPVFSLNSSNDATLEIDNFNQSEISSVVLVLVNYSTDEASSTFAIRGGLGTDGSANIESYIPAPTNNIPDTDGSDGGGCFIESIDINK